MKALQYFFVLLIFGMVSCSPSELKPAEYIRYFQDNGLPQAQTQIGNLKVIMKVLPSEYLLLQEEKPEGITQKVLDEKRKLIYVHLDFADVNSRSEAIRSAATNEMELFQKIQYASFDAQKDVFLIQGEDTISCALYHFERAYNLASNNKMVLAFSNEIEKDEDLTLRYEDKIFGIGIIHLKIDKKELNSIPKLKI